MKYTLPKNLESRCEKLSKSEMISIIKSMQEQQNTLLSDLMSKPDHYRKFMSSLRSIVDQQEDGASLVSVMDEITKLLNSFEQNVQRQLNTQQDLLEMKSASLDSVISNLDLCVIQINESGLISEYNTRAEEIFERLFDKKISKDSPLLQHFSDDNLKHQAQKNINYCLIGKAGQFSEVFTQKEKSCILNLRFYPIQYNGDILGVSIIIEDLTQKHQEESLFRLLNSAVIYANDAIMVTEVNDSPNRKSSIIYVNRAFCDLSGYTEEELIGESPHLMEGDQSVDSELLKLRQATSEGRAARTELIHYRKDGTPYWVNFSIVPLKDENENITHWISIQRDVTESRKAEETILEQKNYLESINRNTSESIICADEHKRPRFTNRTFQKLFQYQNDEIILDDLFADAESLSRFNEILTREGLISNVSFLYKRKDGSNFWGLTSFSISEYRGKRRYDGAIRDISDIKATEQILKEKNQALEKTNEELDRFVYSASHDLRAPLASSLGLINISRISTDQKEKHVYLDMMEQSLNKMDKTIQDITDYQRNARLEIETEEIHFESLIADVTQRLKYLKQIDEVKISTKISGNHQFYTDKIRLYVILINLISNAIKFIRYDIDEPRVNISVSITQEKACILVEDNGIGIDSVHLDKVFGMFFQAARESSGSGLGLYIVKESINKLKGSVKVRSNLNVGTSFEITLPNEIKTNN